eukprot:366166-Chlamydomonas_euryale.AAC.8
MATTTAGGHSAKRAAHPSCLLFCCYIAADLIQAYPNPLPTTRDSDRIADGRPRPRVCHSIAAHPTVCGAPN